MANGEISPKTFKVWDLLFRACVPIVAACCTALIMHEVRLAKIEDNRFTSTDGRALKEELKSELPPAWLREQMRQIADGQAVLRDGQSAINNKMAHIEAKLENHRHDD